ncbi:hypothetical protein B0H63DRAFT_298288 [Podospora didyma]|uniref:Secreted protein n=1 Tax=Podospora didyma TaxID=330526 RepID=A0AAE0N704_9PEZI|nr:hypothetical protein B0H63DRAFT_298288 [Podospora didyma]
MGTVTSTSQSLFTTYLYLFQFLNFVSSTAHNYNPSVLRSAIHKTGIYDAFPQLSLFCVRRSRYCHAQKVRQTNLSTPLLQQEPPK